MEVRFVMGPLDSIELVEGDVVDLLGYRADELLGEHGTMLVPTDAHPVTAVSIDRMRRGELTTRTARMLRRDGREVRVEVHGRPLPDGRIEFVIRGPVDG